MSSLLQFTVNVCRLRDGPQNAPPRKGLFGALIVTYTVLSIIAYQHDNSIFPPLLPAIQSLAIGLLVPYQLLKLAGHADRFIQTAITLLLVGCLLGAVYMLLLVPFQANPENINPMLALLALTLFSWSFVVDAHIYRHALNISMTRALLIVVAIFAGNQMLLQMWYYPSLVQ